MKYLKTYRIFESSSSEDTEMLLELIRADLEDINIDEPFTHDDIFISACDFVVKKNGEPIIFNALEYQVKGIHVNEPIEPIDMRIMFQTKYPYTSKGIKRKAPEIRKNGLALLLNPEKGDLDFDDTWHNLSERFIQNIYSHLNEDRYTSYGFEVLRTKGPYKSPIILFYIK